MDAALRDQIPYDEFMRQLQVAGLADAAHEIAAIAAKVLKLESASAGNMPRAPLTEAQKLEIAVAVSARARRIPLERIFPDIRFGNITLHVQNAVYKPYPETLDALAHCVDLFPDTQAPLRILDLGTGSGCILLSLLQSFPQASGIGIDGDFAALLAAQANAEQNILSERATFLGGNWSDDIHEAFDLVVSNPPRVATSDLERLLPEMRDHDPQHALDGGADGLHFFRLLAQDFKRRIKPGGFGCAQVGPRYAEAVVKIFTRAGLHDLQVKTTLFGHPVLVVYQAPVPITWKQRLMRYLKR